MTDCDIFEHFAALGDSPGRSQLFHGASFFSHPKADAGLVSALQAPQWNLRSVSFFVFTFSLRSFICDFQSFMISFSTFPVKGTVCCARV